MSYHITKLQSRKELARIIDFYGLANLKKAWPWLPGPTATVPFLLDCCHVYRVDKDRMHYVIGTRNALALFLVSDGQFYVYNRSEASHADKLAVFNAFCDACDFDIKTYIPPEKKALARLCMKYGFNPIGEGYYVKQQTTRSGPGAETCTPGN